MFRDVEPEPYWFSASSEPVSGATSIFGKLKLMALNNLNFSKKILKNVKAYEIFQSENIKHLTLVVANCPLLTLNWFGIRLSSLIQTSLREN